MIGIVVKSTGSNYRVRIDNGDILACKLKGKFRNTHSEFTNPIAVGDSVKFEKGSEPNTYIIKEIRERRNYILRKSNNLSRRSQIIAANVDQVLLVVTLAQPRTSFGFIDRILCTCERFHIPVRIVVNKKDLFDAEAKAEYAYLNQIYTSLNYPVMVMSALAKTDIVELNKWLENKVSLITGHSGVGKSTLINTLIPGFELKTGAVSETTSKGRHTTSYAEMYPMSGNAHLIDTPGLKDFGLMYYEADEIGHGFREINKAMSGCKFNNCQHINEPDCAIKINVENEKMAPSRYLSYLSMMDELMGA